MTGPLGDDKKVIFVSTVRLVQVGAVFEGAEYRCHRVKQGDVAISNCNDAAGARTGRG